MPARDFQATSRRGRASSPSDPRLNRRLQTTLSHRQMETNVNVAQNDPMGETKIVLHATKRSSRRNVNESTAQPLPEKRLTLQEMRSARRSTIKESQTCEKNHDVVLETASRRQNHHHRSSHHNRKTDEKYDDNARSLSPTRDLANPGRRTKTQGTRPSINEKLRSSDTRARTSLALKKFGELSSSLNNGSATNWADASSTSVPESNNDSTDSILESQTQRMKTLSQMFHNSKDRLQQQAQDSKTTPTTSHLNLAIPRIH